jgi:hypothetical protein
MLILACAIHGADRAALAQQTEQWTPQQTIPDFHYNTNPPYLLADQNRTVHAFSTQWLGEEEGLPVRAIVYNQWTAAQGWTKPVDILLSPVKEARFMDVFLDQQGMMHLIFFGGDETDSNLYYTQAPATKAALAPAWSLPVVIGEAANNPDVAALAGDGQGNMVVVYSSNQEGWGIYTLHSTDHGASWSAAAPTFLTYDAIFPVLLKLYRGESGLIHAIWDLRERSGQGRQIVYAHLDPITWQWSVPITLAEAETGYGVLIPTVIEYQHEVIAAYSGITFRRSSDNGQTWSDPITPFRQVGVNGMMSFVVDSHQILHFLWAQRLTGEPDLHGVWHSRWEGGRWTEPIPVVLGPMVPDLRGDQAYDPYDVRAVVSQGNALLVTWRSDPGNRGNGVWYSYRQLDAPELPLAVLPTVAPTVTPTATPILIPLARLPAAMAQPLPNQNKTPVLQQSHSGPAQLLLAAVLPVVLLVAVVLIQVRRTGNQHDR